MAKNGRSPDAPPPAFQFYPSDFLSDENVAAMTYEERGAYITLLCIAWREGSIPSNEERIGRLLHLDRQAIAKLWPAISSCWVSHSERADRLVQPRMERERQHQRDYHEERVRAGKLGANARWGDGSSAIAQPMANDSTTTSTTTSTSKSTSSPPTGVRRAAAKKPRKKPGGEHDAFIEWWCAEFEKATKAEYAFEGAKDGAHVKAILKLGKGDHDLIKKRAISMLYSDDPFYAEKGVNLSLLRSQWNRLASGGRVNGKATQLDKSLAALRRYAEAD